MFFHTKPITPPTLPRKQNNHSNSVDLEPTFFGSVEESMVGWSVMHINYFKTGQHQKDELRFSNSHDSKFHRSS